MLSDDAPPRLIARLPACYGGDFVYRKINGGSEREKLMRNFCQGYDMFLMQEYDRFGYNAGIEELVDKAEGPELYQLPRLIHVHKMTAIWLIRDLGNLFREGIVGAMTPEGGRWTWVGIGIEGNKGDFFVAGGLSDIEMQSLHDGLFPRTLRKYGLPGPHFRRGMLGHYFKDRSHPGPSTARGPRATTQGPGTEDERDFEPGDAHPDAGRPRNNPHGGHPQRRPDNRPGPAQGRPNQRDLDHGDRETNYGGYDDDEDDGYEIDGIPHGRRPTRRPPPHSYSDEGEDFEPPRGSRRPHGDPFEREGTSTHRPRGAPTNKNPTNGSDGNEDQNADDESNGFSDLGRPGATLPPAYKTTLETEVPNKGAKGGKKEKRTGL